MLDEAAHDAGVAAHCPGVAGFRAGRHRIPVAGERWTMESGEMPGHFPGVLSVGWDEFYCPDCMAKRESSEDAA